MRRLRFLVALIVLSFIPPAAADISGIPDRLSVTEYDQENGLT
jgi:hypothetical protein